MTYDGMSDRVVAQTNAPSSITDPLATEYEGQLVIEDSATGATPPKQCHAAHGPLRGRTYGSCCPPRRAR